MSIFNLRVELDDDSLCNGCPSLIWEENLNYYDCTASGEIVSHEFSQLVFRPSWCPLIPRIVHKVEPSPLTEEELAELKKEEEEA